MTILDSRPDYQAIGDQYPKLQDTQRTRIFCTSPDEQRQRKIQEQVDEKFQRKEQTRRAGTRRLTRTKRSALSKSELAKHLVEAREKTTSVEAALFLGPRMKLENTTLPDGDTPEASWVSPRVSSGTLSSRRTVADPNDSPITSIACLGTGGGKKNATSRDMRTGSRTCEVIQGDSRYDSSGICSSPPGPCSPSLQPNRRRRCNQRCSQKGAPPLLCTKSRPQQRPRDADKYSSLSTAPSKKAQTAKSVLQMATHLAPITDAETGEPLELKWRVWEFPLQRWRSNLTKTPSADSLRSWSEVSVDTERGTGLPSDVLHQSCTRQKISNLCIQGYEGEGRRSSVVSRAGSDRCFTRELAGYRVPTAIPRNSARFTEEDGTVAATTTGGSPPNSTRLVALVGSHPSGQISASRGENVSTFTSNPSLKQSCKPENVSQEESEILAYPASNEGSSYDCAASGEGAIRIRTSPSEEGGGGVGGAYFSFRREDYDDLEPPTPRSTEPLHSPFWMPPAQKPPMFSRPTKSRAQTAIRAAARSSSPARACHKSHHGSRRFESGSGSGSGKGGGSGGGSRGSGHGSRLGSGGGSGRGSGGRSYSPPARRRRRVPSTSRPTATSGVTRPTKPLQPQAPQVLGQKFAHNDGGDSRSAQGEERAGNEGYSSGSAGATPGVVVSVSDVTVPEMGSEDARRDMIHVQHIRDRYLSQLQQMILEEREEEKRRAVAIRKVAGHPLRTRRLRLRHDRERKGKQALVNWIRRDIELIVVQRMAELGLIR